MKFSLSLDQQLALTGGASMWSTVAVPEAGIPPLTMADGPMGIASGRIDERDIALLTPCPLALGATWDVSLCERVGTLVGREAIRKGINLVLAPNVNLARSPLAGRSFEYFSEDPLLTGAAAAAWLSGVQGTGTGAVVKHLVCNDSETDRDTMNVVIGERALREVYLMPFELCAKAGVAAIMAAYNRVNGRWSAEQDHVITIVKDEWGYAGPVMSDWFATHSTAASLNAGLDLEMPGPPQFLGPRAADVVAAGEVARPRIEDAACRVSEAAAKFGGSKSLPGGGEDPEALLIEAAASSFVLLKNADGILPLVPGRHRRIAVIGPNAIAPCFQGGTFAKISVSPDAITPLDALRARFGNEAQVDFEPGVDQQPRLPSMPVRPARDLGDGARDGMTIDYHDGHSDGGTLIASETRNTNSLVWFAGIHDDVLHLDRPGRVVARGRFLPEKDGDYTFYVGATGPVSLRIDGREILCQAEPVAATDVMGVLKRGDAASIRLPLVAGSEHLIEVEFEFDPARAHGLWYGIRPPDNAEAMLERAAQLARAADVVLLFVGETADASVESKDRLDTLLAANQRRLIDVITQANQGTVVFANVGHAIDTAWEEQVAGLMMVWYPGQNFGQALAEVVAGDREPGGRMPVTIARRECDYPVFALQPDVNGDLAYAEGTQIGYRGLRDARHALGSGLGYAKIILTTAHAERGDDGATEIVVTATNTSDRAGSQVIQAYRRFPELALVGFAKVQLEPGEKRDVTVDLHKRSLQIWRDGWEDIVDPRLFVGRSADDVAFEVALDTAAATGQVMASGA